MSNLGEIPLGYIWPPGLLTHQISSIIDFVQNIWDGGYYIISSLCGNYMYIIALFHIVYVTGFGETHQLRTKIFM